MGWHTWTWGFVAAGLLIGASGLAVDFLLPTSANYTLDAADFIGPGAVAVGASAVVAAFALNPFWWIGNDDEAPDAKGE